MENLGFSEEEEKVVDTLMRARTYWETARILNPEIKDTDLLKKRQDAVRATMYRLRRRAERARRFLRRWENYRKGFSKKVRNGNASRNYFAMPPPKKILGEDNV